MRFFSFNKRFFLAGLSFGALLLLTRCGAINPDASVTVDITPAMVTVAPGDTVIFHGAETTNRTLSRTIDITKEAEAFVWTISEGNSGGILTKDRNSSTGYLYVAPTAPGTYHVVIWSKQDMWASATAYITVR